MRVDARSVLRTRPPSDAAVVQDRDNADCRSSALLAVLQAVCHPASEEEADRWQARVGSVNLMPDRASSKGGGPVIPGTPAGPEVPDLALP
jgi:hypothetical protein